MPIHRAVPQPEDVAKSRQARQKVLSLLTAVRDFGVELLSDPGKLGLFNRNQIDFSYSVRRHLDKLLVLGRLRWWIPLVFGPRPYTSN